MEMKAETDKNEPTGSPFNGETVVGRRHSLSEKVRVGRAEYSQMIDQDDGSEEIESETELDLPEIFGVSLNLSKRKIKKLSEASLRRMNNVQYLYLEGNELTELPVCFFQSLPNLKWLDLRNNNLRCLPTDGLQNHPSLEFILLQGNRVRNLPVELATVPYLKGLQISGNPITNVPYDAIAEGFHGLMKHLQTLHAQEKFLLPVSETIVVKPSTSRGKSINDTESEAKELSDSELRMWNLDELSQWRQFMKKKSEANKFSIANDAKNKTVSQPKISVSVRSQPKPNPKPRPFRCGIYNRNRHKTTSPALRYLKMRKTRLGYKRKPITPAMLEEKAKKEAFKAQMRETLEKQAKKIQRLRDKEALKSWRDHAKFTRQQLKLLDNFQQYPSKDFSNNVPFDVDPDFLNMLNRVDIYRSLKEYDGKSKRIRKPKPRISALDLDRQMNEIMEKLQELNTGDVQDRSPRTRHQYMYGKMHKIIDIQKTLKNLQELNSSMSGIVPLVKPKPKNSLKK